MTVSYHIALNEADFRILVGGGVIERRTDAGTIKLILSDIGFSRMMGAIVDAAIRREVESEAAP